MILNYIWVGFFIIAFVIALIKLIFFGDVRVFSDLVNSTFDTAKNAFEVSLYLTGVISLWLGLLKIAERGGIVNILAKIVGPVFTKLFPHIPKGHPVIGTILLNFSTNILGIDNAGTPLGMKAMQEMQAFNPEPEKASNPQIMFIVINCASLTVIPINIIAYRVQAGAVNPTDVFIPILIAKVASIFAGLIAVSFYQKINILKPVVGLLSLIIIPFVVLPMLLDMISNMMGIDSLNPLERMSQQHIQDLMNVVTSFMLFSVIMFFIIIGLRKKINIFEAFIDGAKEGFNVAIQIIPYLVAILVAVGVFRISGAMNYVQTGLKYFFDFLHVNTDFIPAIPVALMKPLSGSGARGLLIDLMLQYKGGADSFPARVACVLQGSSDTVFYIMAVYYGAVSIKNTRYTLSCALIAALAGFIVAILVSYLFFYSSAPLK